MPRVNAEVIVSVFDSSPGYGSRGKSGAFREKSSNGEVYESRLGSQMGVQGLLKKNALEIWCPNGDYPVSKTMSFGVNQ
jgi:hypothetical protein